MTLVALGAVLSAVAVWDVYRLAASGHVRAAVGVGTLWAVGIGAALYVASTPEAPTLARIVVDLVHPLGRWVP